MTANNIVTIRVAVGLIQDHAGYWLCCQRSLKDRHAGLWEFPGGKLENTESVWESLQRELLEELSLAITGHQFVQMDAFTWHHSGYSTVELNPVVVRLSSRPELNCHVHQAVKWLLPDQMLRLDWLASNIPIIEWLKSDRR